MLEQYFTVEGREKLYNEVWEEPLSAVAKRYETSEATLRKRCGKLNIPLPQRGELKKIRSGEVVNRPPLSKVFGSVCLEGVRKSIIEYKYSSNELSDEELEKLKEEELSILTDETKRIIKKRCADITVKNQLKSPHRYIIEHKEEMIFRKEKEKEIKETLFLSGRSYLSEEKLHSHFHASLPIKVSKGNLKRVYHILDSLFKAIEGLDGKIVIQHYITKDVGYFIIGRHFYGFAIKEYYKKNSKKKKDNEHSIEEAGTLVLVISIDKSDIEESHNILEYKDSETEPLEMQLSNILYNLFVITNKLDIAEEISSREFHRKLEEEKRQRHLEKMRKAELEKVSYLENMITDWDRAQKMRSFADNIEKNNSCALDDKKGEILEWIRDKADWLDPLTAKEDKLLGKRSNISNILRTIEIANDEDE